MRKFHLLLLVLTVFFISCENQDWDFPDFDYQTVYFSYQSPVRTITLGEDIFDTSLDNQHKTLIMATTGGAYSNPGEIAINFVVDNSLVEGFVFESSGEEIIPMPENYYSLASNQIIIPRGEPIGGVEVQYTDAFFNDPLAIKNTYVIPLVMTSVQNADSILSGSPLVDSPHRVIPDDWEVAPKDYILYAVKYINPWHGSYLRRGEDVITGKNGNSNLDGTFIRQEEFVESDEVNQLITRSMAEVEFPLVFQDSEGVNMHYTLILTFDEEGNCIVSAGSEDFTASGSGNFVSKGEKNSWGNRDRDVIYLTYEIELDEMHVSTTDTLVLRDRGVGMETFSPVQQ